MSRNKLPSDFFIFRSPRFADPGEPEDAFVFTSAPTFEVPGLIEALKTHRSQNLPPGRLFLIGPGPLSSTIIATLEDESLRNAVPELTRYQNPPPLIPMEFNKQGEIRSLDESQFKVLDMGRELTREGLRWIFDEREGMLRAGPGFHYLNPSGRHSTVFIRTGNVLLHSAEIAFIAMGLLKWWPDGLRRIFVDTASISSVAYALVELRRQFDKSLRPPSIDSFSSYAGLAEFGFLQDSLCLISASTSGSLHRRIVNKRRLPSDRVVTLFYCGPPTQEHVLCDLTERSHQEGLPEPKSYKRMETCELCRRGSDIIGISGDQFLPADPEVSEVVLTAKDAPRWLNEFLQRILGQEIVRCHGGRSVDGAKPREIFFFLEEAVQIPSEDEGEKQEEVTEEEDEDKNPPKFFDHLRRQLDTLVPASLNAIVHVDNASSAAMAATVQEYFAELGGNGLVPTINAEKLQNETTRLPPQSSVLVVIGATASGRTLLGISQYLRNVAKARSIVYLIGVARSKSEAEWERLQSNLTWGRRQFDYPLASVASAHLPTELSEASSPWATEWRFLGEVREHIEKLDAQVQDAVREIESRRDRINAASSIQDKGLKSTVFLPRVRNGQVFSDEPVKMELGPGFVFWAAIPQKLKQKPTQAEVYLTLAAILHHLRGSGRPGTALVQHEHNRTVLAPTNFGRFNDGVIQAAILRAARPRELDYSHNKDSSAQMREAIERFIKQREGPEGEGAPEFLLALAQERIRLEETHQEELLRFLDNQKLPPFMWALVQWMHGRNPLKS
jgi:hypothetical protein